MTRLVSRETECDTGARVQRRVVVIVLVAAVAAAPVGAAAPLEPDPSCAVGQLPLPAETHRYTLTVRVLEGLREVTGRLSVRFAPERATDRVVFRLWPNMPYLARQGSRLTVGEVTLDGARFPVVRPNPTTLVLKRTLAAGEVVVMSMPWQLRLPDGSANRLDGGSMARLGSFFPLLAWNPGEGWQIDAPSSIGWETWTSPTADFDVKVTAPQGLQVLASGEQVASGRWRAHAVRDFALAVGRFTVVRGTAAAPGRVRLIVGVERGTRASARRYLGWARAALEAHARRFGPYPWSTFSLVGADTGRFSWEYPTLVFASTTQPTPRQGTAHEVAHQWFYSLVGNNQARDPWLDETLASWGEARFSSRLVEIAAGSIPEPVRNRLGEPMRFWDQFDIAMFIDGAYNQGVQALVSLGEPEDVDCALRLYALENAYEIAGPADLLRALERFFPAARRQLEAFGARF